MSQKYIGIANDDIAIRVQHTIRNLMELDETELEYVRRLNTRDMFEIVKLFNMCITTLVQNLLLQDDI